MCLVFVERFRDCGHVSIPKYKCSTSIDTCKIRRPRIEIQWNAYCLNCMLDTVPPTVTKDIHNTVYNQTTANKVLRRFSQHLASYEKGSRYHFSHKNPMFFVESVPDEYVPALSRMWSVLNAHIELTWQSRRQALKSERILVQQLRELISQIFINQITTGQASPAVHKSDFPCLVGRAGDQIQLFRLHQNLTTINPLRAEDAAAPCLSCRIPFSRSRELPMLTRCCQTMVGKDCIEDAFLLQEPNQAECPFCEESILLREPKQGAKEAPKVPWWLLMLKGAEFEEIPQSLVSRILGALMGMFSR